MDALLEAFGFRDSPRHDQRLTIVAVTRILSEQACQILPVLRSEIKMSSFKWKENMNGKGIDLPPTFKCRICSKIKPSTNDHFSKKELKTFQSRSGMGRAATGFSANLRCRHCSGENVFELLCQYCQVTKSKDDFSYNQRTTALVARCKACVNWSETNEPGTETLPGPSMALHPDSMLAPASNPNVGNALSALVNPANQAASDEDGSSVWRTTNPSNNTMSVPAGTSVRPTTTRASVAEARLPSAPSGFMAPTRMLRHGEVPGDAFSQLDPFGRRGGNADNANAAILEPVFASSAASEVATDAAADDKWMVVPQKKKTAKAAVARDASDSFTNPFTAHNAYISTMCTDYDAPDSPPTTPAPRNTGTRASTNRQTIAPSVAPSTQAAASTAFEEGIASGKYGRPGHTTPRGNSSREWYKPTKPRKDDTFDHGFETYAPADIANHAPPIRRPANEGDESDDEW
ncbi:hypothetical protein V496_04508 [Pseudogymnoascus sp. VKM F-4515 (FW-2607)]|nr:hypothetical protein V496_04508 [Pseudogymnoascus sp. VKM F-4515 (FW-2607)]